MKPTVKSRASRVKSPTPAAAKIEKMLAAQPHLQHLRITERGDTIMIVGGDESDPEPHARLTGLGHGVFGLSFPTWNGRWERTPFTGSVEEIFATLVEDLGFHLAPR